MTRLANHRKKSVQQRKKREVLPGAGRRQGPLDRRMFKMPATVSRPALLDEDGGSDHRFRQFIYDFFALAAQMELVLAYLSSQLNLSSPQYNIVMTIAQYQDAAGISVSDVAQHLHVTTAFITSETKKLERLGFIEKCPNPNDGRGVLLRLTELGEARVLQIGPKRLLINDHLFRDLSQEQFRQLSQTVSSLVGAFAETINMLKIMGQGQSRPHDQVGRFDEDDVPRLSKLMMSNFAR
jgi:DNA-binding MarR family transcriptional regulator